MHPDGLLPTVELGVEVVELSADQQLDRHLSRITRRVLGWVIDGLPIRQLLRQWDPEPWPEPLVTIFDWPLPDPVPVLLGRARVNDWVPEADRIPVLGCFCGDPLCGAYTAAVTVTQEQVMWSQWAWENQLDPPAPVDGGQPVIFERGAYDAVLRRAATLAPQVRQTIITRVGTPRRRARQSPDAQARAWLQVTAVLPEAGDAEGSYATFLADLSRARTLAASTSAPPRLLADTCAALLCSPHLGRLPSPSQQAVRQFALPDGGRL